MSTSLHINCKEYWRLTQLFDFIVDALGWQSFVRRGAISLGFGFVKARFNSSANEYLTSFFIKTNLQEF